MNDELYYRGRAATEARLAEASVKPLIRSIHEELCRAYLDRAEAARLSDHPAR